MKIKFGKVLSLMVGCLMVMSIAVSAASSTATISDSQSSATGNYIYTGTTVPISATLSVRCTTVKSAASIRADAMEVYTYWPDSSLGSCETGASTTKSVSVSLGSKNNAYYVKLTQGGVNYKTNGDGSLVS